MGMLTKNGQENVELKAFKTQISLQTSQTGITDVIALLGDERLSKTLNTGIYKH
jgi:hypothetical protein